LRPALALVGGTLGWLVAVVAQQVGSPSVADLLRGPPLADAVSDARSQVAASGPAAVLLVSLPFAWLASLAQLPAAVSRPAWVGTALAVLALAEAAAARLTAPREALRPVVAPSAALVAVGAVVASLSDRDPLLLAAVVAIAIAAVLGRGLDRGCGGGCDRCRGQLRRARRRGALPGAARRRRAVRGGGGRPRSWLVRRAPLDDERHRCHRARLALLELPLAATARPVLWVAVGLVLIAVAALRRWQLAAHLAAVGHLVTVAALVLAAAEGLAWLSPDAEVLALALVGGTLGWLVAVVAQQVGSPSVADLLRGPPLADAVSDARSQVAASGPAAVLLVSLPFAWLASLAQLPAAVSRPAWVGTALAVLALAEAAAARLTAPREALRPVVAPSAALVAVGAVVASLSDRDPLLLAAVVAIAIAAVLGRGLVPTPYRWFAWLQSGVVLLLLAELAGLRAPLLPTVLLLWGAALLIAGLAVDDRLAGRRPVGVWIRRPWLRAPVVLGAAGIVLAYGGMTLQAAIGFDGAAPTRLGWWSLVVAGVVVVVALQLTFAPLSGLAALVATVGLALLSPWPVTDHPWVLVGFAGVLVAVAWLLERLVPRSDVFVTRWDLPSLAAAHLVAAAGLVLAPPAGAVAATWLAAGALAAAVAAWQRQRAWADASNLLLVVGAGALGDGWLTLAFAGTAIRGILAASRTEGSVRGSYLAIGVLGAGAGWLSLVGWLAWSAPRAIAWSTVGFGLLAVLVAVLLRLGWLARDAAASWAGLAVAAEGVALVSIVLFVGDLRPVGIAPAVGVALLGLAATVAAPVVSSRLHDVAAGFVVGAWLLAIFGAGWVVEVASMVTAGTFAVVAIVTVEVARRRTRTGVERLPAEPVAHHLARAWFGTAVAGVGFGAVLARFAPEPRPVLIVLAGALVVLAVAAARAPDVLAWPVLRQGAGLLAVAGAIVLALAFEVPVDGLALLLLGLGLTATLVALVRWRTMPASPWLQPLVTVGLVASLCAALLAITEPSGPVLPLVFAAFAAQSAGIGLVLRRPGVLAMAPAFAVAGWFGLLVETPVDGIVWVTIPIAVALLAEVEVARWWRRQQAQQPTSRELLVLELAAIGLLALPPLTELFTTGLAVAVVAVVLAAALLLWGAVTRVRRRVVAAAALATATAVLTIAAAAAGRAPTSAFVWIVTGGVGVTLLFVVALVEAARSRGGGRLRRLDELTADWE
jgi:hypothetical protein